METSWFLNCILGGGGFARPHPSFSLNTRVRLASQQGAGLLLCQLELHAGAPDGKPSGWGWLLKP